jgi:hypothetical protein
MGRAVISLIVKVPAAEAVTAMPPMSSRSAMPEIVSALTAVRGRAVLPISRNRNWVQSIPSQKKSIPARLSLSSAPLMAASLKSRYSRNSPACAFSRSQPAA